MLAPLKPGFGQSQSSAGTGSEASLLSSPRRNGTLLTVFSEALGAAVSTMVKKLLVPLAELKLGELFL